MSAKTSTQLVKLNAKPFMEGQGTKYQKLVLDYTRIDSDKPQNPSKASKFVNAVTDIEKALLKTLQAGDEVVITKEEGKPYTNKAGITVTPWNLTTIAAKDTWVAKPKKTFTPGKPTGGYDNLGQQIGNSLTNAVNSLGAGYTVEQYRQRALEFVLAGDWVREQVEKRVTGITAQPAADIAELLAEPSLESEWDVTIADGLDDLDTLDF